MEGQWYDSTHGVVRVDFILCCMRVTCFKYLDVTFSGVLPIKVVHIKYKEKKIKLKHVKITKITSSIKIKSKHN